MAKKSVLIVGGGLAGLVTSIHLTRAGVACTVIEKKKYPFHRVCGEYISNEVKPYLNALGIFPASIPVSQISEFQLTSVNGKEVILPLDLGGFGISRYAFDDFLFQRAEQMGVKFKTDTEVEHCSLESGGFQVQTTRGTFFADVVVGAFGKRSRIDVDLARPFVKKRSPYVGVKYHVRLPDFPQKRIALHNFQDGYCGISCVESDTLNLCYLTHRDPLKKHGSIPALEEAVLFQNPFLERIFKTAKFLFEKPETINEISFETKAPVDNHMLMTGDAAGMITPLCGNGMAMAIHSSKIASEHILRFCSNRGYTRQQMEVDYEHAWKKKFAGRLWAGRQIQRLFGDVWSSNLAVNLARSTPSVANFLMRNTHGDPFDL